MLQLDKFLSTSAFGRDGVRWRIATLLLLITAVNYLDRQAMAIAIPVLQEEFGITSAAYGLITSGFLLAYAISQATAGRILDRFGTAKGLSQTVVLQSIAGILHITDMFPPKSVGTVWGLCGAAGSVGAMLFQPLIGWTADAFFQTPVFIAVSSLPLASAIIVSATLGPLHGDKADQVPAQVRPS